MEEITRIQNANGTYRYESTTRGTLIESSKVLYTAVAHFICEANDPNPPLTFHKTLAAAAKTSNKYWTKARTAEIQEVA